MIRGTIAAGLLSLAAVFAYVFEDRYWRWRDCFNELGRCWDSESQQVYLEQAGIIWGGLAAICLAGALLILPWRRPKKPRAAISAGSADSRRSSVPPAPDGG